MRVRWILLPWAIAACAGREPVRFGSPLLGMAQVPPPALPGESPRPDGPSNRDPMPSEDRPLASESAAAAITRSEVARTRAQLPAPHRAQERHCALPPCRFRNAVDLHDVVGHREKGDAMAITLGWARELGLQSDATTATDLIAWAERTHRLHGAGEQPSPGDLLIFERTASDDGPDLIAITVSRDPRGVIEMIYIAGGVVRRGFVDASRPTKRRDRDGAVVNTYLRHGKRSPPKGTRYLAGELLLHVIRG